MVRHSGLHPCGCKFLDDGKHVATCGRYPGCRVGGFLAGMSPPPGWPSLEESIRMVRDARPEAGEFKATYQDGCYCFRVEHMGKPFGVDVETKGDVRMLPGILTSIAHDFEWFREQVEKMEGAAHDQNGLSKPG